MQQLCAHLDRLTSPEMRTAVERAIDAGRRPEEICALDFDCLTRDDDGLPVLIYDNHKANRPARRLPISEQTAAVVIAQQQRVRTRYPHTPVGELNCCPPIAATPVGAAVLTPSREPVSPSPPVTSNRAHGNPAPGSVRFNE